jgi:hypothetical protein
MPEQAMSHTCSCSCGASKVQVAAPPLLRFICHCTICQAVFKRPCADVMVYWAGDVSLQENHAIQFKKYRLPPAVHRGLCSACDSPMLGILRLAPFVSRRFCQNRMSTFFIIAGWPISRTLYRSTMAIGAVSWPSRR